MSKNNRTQVARRLTEEINQTTDPQTLIELTKQLAKVLPKRRGVKKSNSASQRPSTGSMVDNMPEDERLTHDIVVRAEKIIREAKQQGLTAPTDTEAIERAKREIEEDGQS